MTDAEVHALHTGRDGGSLNTDTMMIVHVPADGSKATIISLPRDSYVDIPGFRRASSTRLIRTGTLATRRPSATEKRTPRGRRQRADPGDPQLTGSDDRPLRRGRPDRLLPDQQRDRTDHRRPVPRDQRPDRIALRRRQGQATDRRRDGARVRPAARRSAARRPRPHRAAAVLPHRRVPQDRVGEHAAQSAAAAPPDQRRRQVDLRRQHFSIATRRAAGQPQPDNIVGRAIPTDGNATSNGQSVLMVNPAEVRAW